MKCRRKNKYTEILNRKIKRWRKDIALFAWDNFRFVPDDWQKEAFKRVERSKRISIKSGQFCLTTSIPQVLTETEE